MYAWINETLMPNLYSGDWYNGQRLTSWRETLQTRDRSTIRLGIARLRQLRIKDGQFSAGDLLTQDEITADKIILIFII